MFNRKTRRARTLAFIALCALVPTGAAHANKQQQAPGAAGDKCHTLNPTRGQLPAGQPQIAVFSYNGVPWRAPTSTPGRMVSRSRDPMAVVFNGGVQPDSVFCVQQQAPSRKLDRLPAQTTCSGLLAESGKLVVWEGKLEVKPDTIASVRDTHTVIFREPNQVLLPNTRVKITGTTREGQSYEAVHTTVQGLPQTNETRYNFNTRGTEQLQIGGRFLASAPVWVEPANVLVSEPVKDKLLAGKGKAFRKISARHERTVQRLNTLIGEVQARISANAYQQPTDRTKDQQLLTRLQQAVPKVQQKAQQFKAQGDAMVAEGSQLRALVFSVAGVPNAASVQTVNTRLQGEGARALGAVSPTMTATANAISGSLQAQVAGIQKDRLVTTVSFPANNSKSSQAVIEHRVPDPRDKSLAPATTITGTNGKRVRLYRMQPDKVQIFTEPADTQ